ncbi:non-ribosomal peptide synthetase [Nocardia thraciensis]
MREQLGLPRAHAVSGTHWGDSVETLRQAIGALSGLPTEVLTDDVDLFGLGLDSVTVMRISGLMRRAGARVEYRDLLAGPTLRMWWELLQRNNSDDPPAVAAGAVERDETAPFPLAVMQHAFWVGRADSQRLGGVAAHLYTEFDRDDGLDLDRLDRAVRDLTARHAMLRITIDGAGMQRVTERGHWRGLFIDDLRSLPGDVAARRLADTRDVLSHRRMDVAAGEVFDLRVSLLPGGRARLHLDLDMIAADALSLRTLLADLTTLYHEGPGALPAIDFSYARYLAERDRARAQARSRARDWWHTQLPTLPGAPELPLLAHENATGGPKVARRHRWLPPERVALLHERARRAGLTTATALATVFAETIGVWSATDRFLLNLPVFDREPLHDDVDRLVGDFSSSVLLDVDLSTRMPVAERGQAIQERLRQVSGYAAYTGVEVLRDLSRANGGARVLAPVVYTSALSLGELYPPDVRACLGAPSWTVSQGPQVWLDAQVTEVDGGLLLNWDVRVSLFPSGMLDAMFDAYIRCIDLLLDDETAWRREAPWPIIAGLGTPDAAASASDGAAPTALHERFFARAAAEPDRIALLTAEQPISYGDLAAAAYRMAGLLAARGIGRGDSVAVTLPKGVDQIVATLGVLAAGATYVPSGVDVPAARREQVYRAAGVRLVVTDADAAAAGVPDGIDLVLPAQARDAEPAAGAVAVDPEDVMYVIFTSGSTGIPKGVEVPHRAVAATVDAVNTHFGIGADDRTIALSALDFDLSAYDLFAFLAYGGSVVVVEEAQRRDAAAWAELVRRWNVTVISAVPALLDMLLVAAADSGLGSALRVVMLGGDRVTVDLPDRLRRLVPGCRFAGLGGMTEAAIHATICEVGAVDADWSSVPYGIPLPHARCRVVDGHGRDRPDWVPGELWVTGHGLAHGYRGDPERTAERFVDRDGARWYRTGDLVRYRPGGTIEFLGRTDHQVKIRGHRIELGEIEAVLADHPQVTAAAAAVVEHATRQLGAVVVVADDAVEDEALTAWLGDRLPGYMVPRRFIRAAELPITRNGKVDRAAVRAMLLVRGRDGEPAGISVPQGRTEVALAAIWRELLGVDEIRRDDDFFMLGGDSLLATRLIRRLGGEGLSGADLAQLFATPTLAAFAAALTFGESEGVPVIRPEPEQRHDPFALTDVQRAFWIGRAERMELGGVGSHFYLEFDGAGVDLDRLEAAWNTVIARHEMLRAVVTSQGTQQILPEVPHYRIERIEAGRAPEFTLHQLREVLSHQVFDVLTWPLFTIRAATYGRDGVTRVRLYAGIDSIIADGRSIMVLFTEWDRLYRDPDATLPPVPLSFRDYVRQIGSDPHRTAAAQEYWARRVRELPPAPPLPLVRAPREIVRPRFVRLRHLIDADRWHRIAQAARTHGITPNAALLACYFQLLGEWSAQRALTVNVTMFDRVETSPAVDGVVGDFASLLLLGHSWAPGEGFAAVAKRLHRQQGRDLAHRDASGIWALRELARHRGTASAPMPVVFTSVLGVANGDASLELSPAFPEPIYGITQTPQVWLDNKVSENRGGIGIDWDVVAELFGAATTSAMFDGYVRLVEGLAEMDWSRPLPEVLSEEQRTLRDAAARALREAAPARSETPPDTPGGDSAVEQTVARLWQALLGVDHVDRADNFFDLGGDSIVATRLMSGLRSEGLDGAELARLFTHPVLHEFAATITVGPRESPDSSAPQLESDPARRHDPFPLTDIQTAYWLGRSDHFDLGGIGAQLYLEYDWPDLDPTRLEHAWNRLIERHAMLRAIIDPDGMQRVLAEVPAYRIPIIDAETVAAEADIDTASSVLRAELSGAARDAGAWPLFAVRVVRDGDRTRVCAVFDNLIADGLSTLVLVSEWMRLYADPGTPLPPLGIEFRDYVTHCAPSEAEIRSALSYWRARSADLPPGPQLPLRVSPGSIDRPRFARREARLERETWHRITERGRAFGLTPSVLLVACYTWVLGAWSAQRDLTVTLTRFDRRDVHPDITRVVGDFTSLLLLADRPADVESWLDRARRLQEQLWRDLDHQQVSAVRVLRELARENAAPAEPVPVVFTSMLGVDDELAWAVRWPDHTCSQTPQVWLDHQVIELPDGLLLSWDSVDELFPAGMVDDMFATYVAQLRRLADADWTLPLPDPVPPQQRAVRDRANDTTGPSPREAPGGGLLHTSFFDVAAADPGRTALIDADTDIGFGALAEHSRRIAALLIERGIRSGAAVGVTAARGAAQIAALYGILAAGAAYVPIAKDQPPQRRNAILDSAEVSVLLTDDSERCGEVPESCRIVDIAEADRCPPAPVYRGDPGDLAYVIFTSGSTGTPKGVEITHGSAVNTLDDLRCRYDIGAGDRVLAVAAADFDLSVFDVFGVLGAGGSAVVTGDEDRRDPLRWLALARDHGVTLWNSVPAVFDMLLTVAEAGPGLPRTLRLVLVSGDWVGLDLPRRVRELSRDCRLLALGGATEAAIWSNCFEVDAVDPEWTSIPYGFPLRNQRYRVVDEAGRDRPDWAVGELWIGGAGVARGYRGEPELTAAAFLEDAGTRWYRTGDLGRYRPGGLLEFLGRSDRQVKIRGHRIELGEIEHAISAHPAVRRALALAVGDREHTRLVAFVEPETGTGATEPELPADLADFVAARVPSAWLPALISLPDPPLTGNGKIDHAALARRADSALSAVESTPGEPIRSGLETRIGQVWGQVTGAAPSHRQISFFAAGGDSLSATRLVSRLETELGIAVTLREFFATPTIAGLARSLPQHEVDLEEGVL